MFALFVCRTYALVVFCFVIWMLWCFLVIGKRFVMMSCDYVVFALLVFAVVGLICAFVLLVCLCYDLLVCFWVLRVTLLLWCCLFVLFVVVFWFGGFGLVVFVGGVVLVSY